MMERCPRSPGGSTAAIGEAAPPLLAARGLVRRYGPRAVVDGVDLDVREGEVLAILGPNGAGKSTLFRLLLILERPDAGQVLLEGRPLSPGDRAAVRRIAGVFQRPLLFQGTVADNLAYGLRARRMPRVRRRARVDAMLDRLDLRHLAEARREELSGGEAQRVALGRALVLEPDILLLDEPTANLDVTVQRRVRRDLDGLVREGARAAVLITHDPGDAFALADRVAVIQEGRVVQVGTPTELVSRPASAFVAEFTGAELLLDGTVASVDEGLVVVELESGARLLAAQEDPEGRLLAGAAVHVAYRPEDVVLAPPEVQARTSARNVFRLRVESIGPSGGLVRVRLTGLVPLAALITRESAETLGIVPGAEVGARMKAVALRAYAARTLRDPSPDV